MFTVIVSDTGAVYTKTERCRKQVQWDTNVNQQNKMGCKGTKKIEYYNLYINKLNRYPKVS